MQKKIDWKLLNNNEIVVDLSNINVDYIPNNILTFKDDEVINTINLINKTYERKSDEYSMIIDSQKKVADFIFKTGEHCSFDIDSSMEIKGNIIEVIYSIDDDQKTIIIDMKE